MLSEPASGTKATILVTGVTGKIGFATIMDLLCRKEASQYEIRGLIRRETEQSRQATAKGGHMVLGDMYSAQDMRRAFHGVDAAFHLPPISHHAIQSTVVFVTEAKSAGVKHIVLLSQWLASDSAPDVLTNQHWLMERLFEQSGLSYTVIAPGFFADNYLNYGFLKMALNLGIWPGVMAGKSSNAPPSNEDIGGCCAAALLDPSRFNGKRFRPTGPELLNAQDMVNVLSKVARKRVRVINLPQFMLLQNMAFQKIDPFLVNATMHYIKESNAGGFELGAPTNHVKLLTGREPESFETIAHRYASYPENAQTLFNKIGAISDMVIGSFVIPYNVAKIRKSQQLPELLSSNLAADNEMWKQDLVVGISMKVYPDLE